MDELGEGTSEAEGVEFQDTSSPCGVESASEIEKDGESGVFVVEGLSDIMVKYYERIYSGGVAFVGLLLRRDGLQGLEKRGEARENHFSVSLEGTGGREIGR